MTAGQDEHSGRGTGGLGSRSFVALLVTQGLGSLNDNLFRWFCVLLGMSTPTLGEATMSLGLICFTTPYLLLASYSAYVGDRFSKRRTIVVCKMAEILIMLLAVGAMAMGNIYLVFLAVFLMGSQSAMFGPAKFGAIPEIVRAEKLSSANGLLQMVTTAASALGMFVGFVLAAQAGIKQDDPSWLQDPGWAQLQWPLVSLVGIAILGTLSSFLITPLTPADRERRVPNPFIETVSNLALLVGNRPLLRAALGEAFFWLLASLATSAITLLGTEILGLDQTNTGLLAIALVIGVGLGSVLAGVMSGGKVELGLVPLGAIVVCTGSLCLYLVTSDVNPTLPDTQRAAVWPAAFWLAVLGLGSGFFIVPLVAFLQDRSERQVRGTILAAANFISFSMMIVSAILFFVLTDKSMLDLDAPMVFLVAGLGTIPVVIYVLWLLPQATARFGIWMLSKLVYRLKVHGRDNLPDRGGALLVANHVTWVDGILLTICSSRPVRFLAYTDHISGFTIGLIAKLMRMIPIRNTDGPKALMRSLHTARDAISEGELVCIFPEGQLTQDGEIQEFHRGMMKVIEGTGAPLVPIYLDELWGSIFSFEGGKFFWKLPRKWPYPASIHIGEPQLPAPETVEEVRTLILALGGKAQEMRGETPVDDDTRSDPPAESANE